MQENNQIFNISDHKNVNKSKIQLQSKESKLNIKVVLTIELPSTLIHSFQNFLGCHARFFIVHTTENRERSVLVTNYFSSHSTVLLYSQKAFHNLCMMHGLFFRFLTALVISLRRCVSFSYRGSL